MTAVPPLRPYQNAVLRAVFDSIDGRRGLTFTVEVARQGGKNELSARLETALLVEHLASGGAGVKCAPTFAPQCGISIDRLKSRLGAYNLKWFMERGHIIRLGRARQSFLSAARDANVLGATADLLLEVDEAQDVDRDKYQKEFRPMASSTNATTILYGTPWDNQTLLEQQKQINLDLERMDGIQRHFRYDWQAVAQYNPDYRAFVEAERDRLGEDHPLFKTQYALETVESNNALFSAQQRAWLQGSHQRQHAPSFDHETYVAGIDIAGESTTIDTDYNIRIAEPARDSTVVTLARVRHPERPSRHAVEAPRHPEQQPPCHPEQLPCHPEPVEGPGGVATPLLQPTIEILDHLWFTGKNLSDLAQDLAGLLKTTWYCKKVVVDATGMGAPIASMLTKLISSREIIPFTFSVQSKSKLGFNLLAAVNGNRLKLYAQDGSPEHGELNNELDRAQARYNPNQTMNFFVDPRDGHDDFISSLSLAVEAANLYEPRFARGRLP